MRQMYSFSSPSAGSQSVTFSSPKLSDNASRTNAAAAAPPSRWVAGGAQQGPAFRSAGTLVAACSAKQAVASATASPKGAAFQVSVSSFSGGFFAFSGFFTGSLLGKGGVATQGSVVGGGRVFD